MAGSQLDAEQMEATAQECETAGEDLGARLQELMVQLENMDKALQGGAGKTFAQVKNTLYTEVQKINRNLDEIAAGIRNAGNMSSQEDAESDQSLRAATQDVDGVNETNQLASGK